MAKNRGSDSGLGLIALISYQLFTRGASSVSCTCVLNLRSIEAAKDQWAIYDHKTTNDSLLEQRLLLFRPGRKTRNAALPNLELA